MKTIFALSGSPRKARSTSNFFIDIVKDFSKANIKNISALEFLESKKAVEDILEADVFLVVTPLYIDSLPAPLIRVLEIIEKTSYSFNQKKPHLYAIINNGFYESEQNTTALKILENFANATKFTWGGGLAIGAGSMLADMPDISKGPTANVYQALIDFTNIIINDSILNQNIYVTPKIPRFLYFLSGNLMWKQIAKKHGVKKRLNDQPFISKKL